MGVLLHEPTHGIQLLGRHGLTGLELLHLTLQLPFLHEVCIFLLHLHETPRLLIEESLLLVSFNGGQVDNRVLKSSLRVNVLLRVASKLVGLEALRLVP